MDTKDASFAFTMAHIRVGIGCRTDPPVAVVMGERNRFVGS